MGNRTPLTDRHREAGARLVDFAGWEMPVHFGSQLDEHHAVRGDAGMFDVSHMTQVDIAGASAEGFLRHVCANDVARLGDRAALYTCLLNEAGGVIDDGIVYRLGEGRYRLVVNAATRDRDIEWLEACAAPFEVSLDERGDLAMIAVQGPNARARAHEVLEAPLAEAAGELRRFHAAAHGDTLVGRTGYTGEDGYEVMLPGEAAGALWDALRDRGVRPCGLGARDTLRLEAGLALYGQEMDESVSPLEAGLGWTIAWDPPERAFIGRPALEAQRAEGVLRRLDGLVLEGKGIARAHYRVLTGAGDGEVTSGGFAPTLGRSIALARLPAEAAGECEVEIRQRRVAARITGYPFVRDGQSKV
jgi:aminomethyltransferase